MEYTLVFNQKQTSSLVPNPIKIGIEQNIFDTIKERISTKKLLCNNIKVTSVTLNEIVVEDFFSDIMKVEDVYRYIVTVCKGKYPKLEKHTNNKFKNSSFNDYCCSDDKETKSIILILESPHKDEYCNLNNIYTPIAPAQGKTGNRIKNNISIVVNELINNEIYNSSLSSGKYRLIICNPVQFQTSLYYLHNEGIIKNLRDRVWKEIFNQEKVKYNFYSRLSKYYPSVIINACTESCSKEVGDFIKTKFSNIEYHKTNNPFDCGYFNIE